MSSWVLDASAVVAFIRGEPGAQVVEPRLASSLLSSVNAGEVVARLIKLDVAPADAIQWVRRLDYEIVAVDAAIGLRAGELSALTRSKGLSLGGRICLALAEREGVPALTADRAWADLGLDIKVSLIR